MMALVSSLAITLPAAFAGDGARDRLGSEVRRVFARLPSFESSFLGESATKLRDRGIPKRIVTVAPSVTEVVFELGAGARVVGVSRYDDFPKEVERLPRVGGFLDPNIEAIVALAPDLVIGVPNAGNRSTLDRIARMGIAVLIVPGNELQDIPHGARAIASALGGDAPKRAGELEARLERDIVLLAESVADKRAPRVAFIYGANPLILAGPGSFADSLLGLINMENIAKVGSAYPQYSLEKLLEDRPDVIIDASEAHGGDGAAPGMRFTAIPAVRDRRVFSLPVGDVLRAGPRIVDGMRTVARLVHR
jgi:iron complex transport system substrate-binding protein